MASAGLLPALDTDVQVMSQLPIAEWWLMALLHGALQLHPCDIEIALTPSWPTTRNRPAKSWLPMTALLWVAALLLLPLLFILWLTESRHTRSQRIRRNGAT